MTIRNTRTILLALTTTIGAMSSTAFAEPGRDPAAAQALFDEGKRLMGLHQYGDACPKLAESQKLDPAGGTLFALALCNEAAGKTATAWANFNEALADARRNNRNDRAEAALQHIHALETQLTRVRLRVVDDLPGLEIKRDGQTMSRVVWTTPVPIDPGIYTFDAQAPNKKPWSSKVTLDGPGRTVEVTIPALEDAPRITVAPPPPVAAPTKKAPPPPAPPPPESDSSKWVPAGVALGVTVGTALLGTYFGLSARSTWNKVGGSDGCHQNVGCPNTAGVNDAKSAGSAADASTVFFLLSGAALVTSGVLIAVTLNGDSKSKEKGASAHTLRLAPAIGRGQAGFVLGGDL